LLANRQFRLREANNFGRSKETSHMQMAKFLADSLFLEFFKLKKRLNGYERAKDVNKN